MYALWWHLACRIGCCRGVSSPALAFKVVCVHVFRGDKNDSSVCMYIAWRADYDPHVHVPVACTLGDPAYNTTSLTLPPPLPRASVNLRVWKVPQPRTAFLHTGSSWAFCCSSCCREAIRYQWQIITNPSLPFGHLAILIPLALSAPP